MNEDFEKELTNHLMQKFQENYYRGLYDGWKACCTSLYEQAKSMTSAKKIIEFLKTEKESIINIVEKSKPTL